MNPRFLAMLFISLLFSCKEEKKRSLADADLTLKEFIELSPVLNLPYTVYDSSLLKKEKDSLIINQTLFQSFIPDSVFKKYYPVTKNLKLYILGRCSDGQNGHYVFVKSAVDKKRFVHLFNFNETNIYTGSTKLLDNQTASKVSRYVRMDGRNNISFVNEQRTATGEFWTDETIYYMDASGNMVLAMTNSTEDLSDELMGNPIDTLPRKHKFSADYSSDKKNLISIRDGNTPKSFLFFIHFNKQNGECTGEVKGEGEFTDNNKGVFRDKSSTCEIQFTFSNGKVSIKEINGCGSYRDITCFFEGSYLKKREIQKSKKK
jgi:hypothetical protein